MNDDDRNEHDGERVDLELDLELDLSLDLDIADGDLADEEVDEVGDDAASVDPDVDDSSGDTFAATELEGGQLSYDCAGWAGESRGLLSSLLSTAGIAHVWQGTTVTVREEDESAVDDLIDEVLATARPALDPGAPRLVYEVGQWPVSLQTELVDALTAADVPYEWDEHGDLVVREEDEDTVAAVLDELPEPDDEQISADDGVAVHELFDSLFMAAAKLAKHPADPSATVSLVDDAEVITRVALPFGFEPGQWRQLVASVVALRAGIDGEASDPAADQADTTGPAGLPSDERIAELAAALRDHLRQYV